MISPARSTACLALLFSLALGGCSTMGRRGEPLVPNRHVTQTGPYRIWTNEPLPRQDPAPVELLDLHRQVENQLGIRVDPREAPIDIHILQDQKSFEHLLTFYFPELPPRRAFFLARGTQRTVFAYRNPHLVEDLRHEATHALLHASVAELPLWLDEGLAEYFEVPADSGGMNPHHLARIKADLADGWSPDLKHLETLRDVRHMTARDYRESWAWAHYFLRGSWQSRGELLGYLADLREGKEQPSPMSQRVEAEADGDASASGSSRFLAYIQNAQPPAPESNSASRAPTVVVRGQDVPDALAAPPPRRRSILGRIAGFIGL